MTLQHHAHIAMPFARSGSAVTSVIRHLVREHADSGGVSTVVLSHNRETTVDGARNVYVDYRLHMPREYLLRRETRLDMAAGILGFERPFTSRVQDPAMAALKEVAPDVIFVHEGHYATSTLLRWRRTYPSMPLVLYVHTALSRSYRRRELRRLISAADAVVCVSDFMRTALLSRSGLVPPTRLVSVLNGTTPDFVERMPDAPERRVLFVGQVAEHKGVHLLVAALQRLVDAGEKWHARIVGSSVHGPSAHLSEYELRLRAMAKRTPGVFEFVPFVDHDALRPHYEWASLTCVPSIFDDPCPLVALEALGAGLPAVASRRGGLPEIGRDAFVYFDPSDPASLLGGLRRASEEVEALRARARQRATEITWPCQYERLMDEVQAVLPT